MDFGVFFTSVRIAVCQLYRYENPSFLILSIEESAPAADYKLCPKQMVYLGHNLYWELKGALVLEKVPEHVMQNTSMAKVFHVNIGV